MLVSKYVPSKLFPKQIAVSMLPHMEALYGGQAGGGKSELLLALALQYVHIPGYSAIVFRRTLTDLKQPGALLDRAHAWLRGAPGCRFAGDEHTYYFETHWPNGVSGHPAKLAFGYIGEANIQTRYQSAEYQCVEKGTHVLMGDGSYQPIENIKIGDRVMTLSGPKPVTRTFGPMLRDCVRVGNQIQGSTHKLLDSTGNWSVCEPSVPIQCCVFDKSVLSKASTNRIYEVFPDNPNYHRGQVFGLSQSLQNHQLFEDWFDTPTNDQIYVEESYDQHQDNQQLLLLFGSSKPFLQHLQSNSFYDSQLILDAHSLYDPTYSLISSYGDRYSFYHDRHDVSIRLGSNSGQVFVPLQACVVIPNRSPLRLGASGHSLKYTPAHSFSYIHPYNSSNLRFSTVYPSFQTFTPERVGFRTVYDLTVADENHFITESGIVNRNCILWDELTQHEEANYLYLFSRLRKKVCPVHKTTADGKPNYKSDCMYCQVYSSLPLRVRSATNPGGIGHQWVRDRFKIEPSENMPIYEIREDDTNINWIGKHPDRPFIQASYRDNPHIDQEAYGKALDELPSIEKARLKYGNWAVNVDARFKRRWVKHYSTRGDRYFVLGRDGVGPIVDMRNDMQRIFVTVDPAASKREGMTEMVVNHGKEASWTVIAVWGLTKDFHLLLLDVVRFQDEIPAVVQALVEVNKRWKPVYFRIEGNGLGKGVVQYAQIYGLTVKEGKRYTDKVVNSTAAQLRMEQGRIWFPQWASWLKDWEDEVFNWTGDNSQADDQVDVLADAAQDVVWEAGDDRSNREEYITEHRDYPACFGYDDLPTYGI